MSCVRQALTRGRLVRAGAGLLALALGLAAWRSGLRSPDASYLLRDREGRFLGEAGPRGPADGAGYWPVKELPPRVVAATLAVEDRRFWRHPGVDPASVLRALWQNTTSARRISGASTLAMQVARMQDPGPRTHLRKLVEAFTAVGLTLRHGREAVLAHYLRIVPYGNRIHGIGYAARRYLDKPVDDLSWAETAFLAAIPQAPGRMNPFSPRGRERAVARGRRILDLLLASGAMGREEHELAQAQIGSLRVPPGGRRPASAMHAVLRLDALLRDPAARQRLGARPVVRTTLDLPLQEEVTRLTREAIDAWEPQGAGNAAVIVLDRESSEVRAWVGSAGFFDARRTGAIDYASIPRSPGSTLKPFLYALALERGVITPATIVDDLDRGPGGIENADERFLGPLLPRAALGNSRNVPAAILLDRAGLAEGYALLRDLGLHDGTESVRRYGLGLAIGGLPVTLARLVRAYTALAGDGRLSELVLSADQPRTEPRRVMSEDSARQIALFLSDPQARLPSFSRMGSLEYPFPVAVKTGTSSRYRDAWAVAFSTRYLVGAWVGDPRFRPMDRLSGYRSAAELAQRVMLHLHRDEIGGLADLRFPPPRGSHPVRLCALTGQRASAACERVTTEWLRRGEEPIEACRAHLRLLVDTRTGQVASSTTPPALTEPRTFVDLPPRYAAWARASNLPRPPLPDGPAMGPELPPRVSVTSPASGLRLLRDPETPADQATLALSAVVDPPGAQVVWYVDGAPWQVVDYPYQARWELQPGEHTFQARLPRLGAASASVRVVVE